MRMPKWNDTSQIGKRNKLRPGTKSKQGKSSKPACHALAVIWRRVALPTVFLSASPSQPSEAKPAFLSASPIYFRYFIKI